MPSRFLAVLMCVVIVAFGLGRPVLASTPSNNQIQLLTLQGELVYETSISIPHYEVSGYVIWYSDQQRLKELVGVKVVVVGEEVVAPSVFMRRAIQVHEIRRAPKETPPVSGPTPEKPPLPKPPAQPLPPAEPLPPVVAPFPPRVPPPVVIAPPSLELPLPAPPEPIVQLPVLPSPPQSNPPVMVEPLPTPFHGSTLFVLFGRVERAENHFVITAVDGHSYWVETQTINFNELVGELVAALAARELMPDGNTRYAIKSAFVLTKDLADIIRSDPDELFRMPSKPITILAGDQLVIPNPPPVVVNGRTLVGLRGPAEAVGAKVEWNQETRSASISLNGRTVVVTVGVNALLLRQQGQPDTRIVMDSVPVIVSGRIMLPLRSLMEGLGLTVEWHEATQTIKVQL